MTVNIGLILLEKQVSEEVERALTKLGHAKLAGRCVCVFGACFNVLFCYL